MRHSNHLTPSLPVTRHGRSPASSATSGVGGKSVEWPPHVCCAKEWTGQLNSHNGIVITLWCVLPMDKTDYIALEEDKKKKTRPRRVELR